MLSPIQGMQGLVKAPEPQPDSVTCSDCLLSTVQKVHDFFSCQCTCRRDNAVHPEGVMQLATERQPPRQQDPDACQACEECCMVFGELT